MLVRREPPTAVLPEARPGLCEPAYEIANVRALGGILLRDAARNANRVLSYWSSEKPARRFCCQQASVDSVQKGFSLP
jgi:hypothetical protein